MPRLVLFQNLLWLRRALRAWDATIRPATPVNPVGPNPPVIAKRSIGAVWAEIHAASTRYRWRRLFGQQLVATLLAHGRRVRVLDLRPPRCSATAVQYVRGSILDSKLTISKRFITSPGMWARHKNDFHLINAQGTEIVIAAARKRGVSRLLHCSTESILFRPSYTAYALAEDVSVTLDQLPGPYTRSKMLGEQHALQAAASGFPVVIANPTMPIGPHKGNLTPPTLMLQYFLSRRVQIYMDFIMNLVDVRDVAIGLMLVMERGQTGQR